MDNVVLVLLTVTIVRIFKILHYLTACIVSPPCLVTRGRILIFIGRCVIILSDALFAQRNASPEPSPAIPWQSMSARELLLFERASPMQEN